VASVDTFRLMLKSADISHEVLSRAEYIEKAGDWSGWVPEPHCATVVRVHPGYRCHFEASFGLTGELLSMGQWEEM
jgi:hypothetical protein